MNQRGAAWALAASVVILIAARLLTLDERPQGALPDAAVRMPGSSAPLPTICLLRRWTAMDCPTCGMTRAFVSLAHGRWRAAWDYHPVSYLVFALTCLNIPLRLREMGVVRIRRAGLGAIGSTRRWELASWGMAFALCVVVWIARSWEFP